jgi:hypothetical protein
MTGVNQAVGELSTRILPGKHGLLDGWLILELQLDRIQDNAATISAVATL